MSLARNLSSRHEGIDAADENPLGMFGDRPADIRDDGVKMVCGDGKDVEVNECPDSVMGFYTGVDADVHKRDDMDECNCIINDYLAAMDKNREKDMNISDELFMSGRGGMGSDAVVHHKRMREERDDRVQKTQDFKVAIARLQKKFELCDRELEKTRAELRRAADQGCTGSCV